MLRINMKSKIRMNREHLEQRH